MCYIGSFGKILGDHFESQREKSDERITWDMSQGLPQGEQLSSRETQLYLIGLLWPPKKKRCMSNQIFVAAEILTLEMEMKS